MRVCQRQRRHLCESLRELLLVPSFTCAFLKSPSSRGLSAIAELLVYLDKEHVVSRDISMKSGSFAKTGYKNLHFPPSSFGPDHTWQEISHFYTLWWAVADSSCNYVCIHCSARTVDQRQMFDLQVFQCIISSRQWNLRQSCLHQLQFLHRLHPAGEKKLLR